MFHISVFLDLDEGSILRLTYYIKPHADNVALFLNDAKVTRNFHFHLHILTQWRYFAKSKSWHRYHKITAELNPFVPRPDKVFLLPTTFLIRRCFVKKVFLKFRKFYRKRPALESLFNNVASVQACYFIKEWLEHRYFLVNFAKFLRTSIF